MKTAILAVTIIILVGIGIAYHSWLPIIGAGLAVALLAKRGAK